MVVTMEIVVAVVVQMNVVLIQMTAVNTQPQIIPNL